MNTVVICGSMKNLDQMTEVRAELESAGLRVITPAADDPGRAWSLARKREASRRHMRHIRNDSTTAVLVVNVDRPDAENYVGPNSFAEIGIAFDAERLMFLLHGMPQCYAEELEAWGVECLNGDLDRLVHHLRDRAVAYTR